MHYFFRKEKRIEQNDFFCANPSLEKTTAIWNMMEQPIVRKMIAKMIPNILINETIWIPFMEK